MMEERRKLVEKEIKLLAEAGLLLNGYSKYFRKMFYDLNQKERVDWLEELVREARWEKSIGAI